MRNQVLRGRENYAKDAIKFYYQQAKIQGLTNELLEAAGLKKEDSLRWSYNKGRISLEQTNAYNHVLGVNKKYLIGEEELTEELKFKEMERIKSKNIRSNNMIIEKVEDKEIYTHHVISMYKNKIANCKNSVCRNQIKDELETFKRDLNENIELLIVLIDTFNIIDDKNQN